MSTMQHVDCLCEPCQLERAAAQYERGEPGVPWRQVQAEKAERDRRAALADAALALLRHIDERHRADGYCCGREVRALLDRADREAGG